MQSDPRWKGMRKDEIEEDEEEEMYEGYKKQKGKGRRGKETFKHNIVAT